MSKRIKPTKILLEGGTSDDHKFLDIAPTPRMITHEGRKYFRCPKSMGQDPADGEWGMMYLWDGWMKWKREQLIAEGKIMREPGEQPFVFSPPGADA